MIICSISKGPSQTSDFNPTASSTTRAEHFSARELGERMRENLTLEIAAAAEQDLQELRSEPGAGVGVGGAGGHLSHREGRNAAPRLLWRGVTAAGDADWAVWAL